jgi:hypothetical protein
MPDFERLLVIATENGDLLIFQRFLAILPVTKKD